MLIFNCLNYSLVYINLGVGRLVLAVVMAMMAVCLVDFLSYSLRVVPFLVLAMWAVCLVDSMKYFLQVVLYLAMAVVLDMTAVCLNYILTYFLRVLLFLVTAVVLAMTATVYTVIMSYILRVVSFLVQAVVLGLSSPHALLPSSPLLACLRALLALLARLLGGWEGTVRIDLSDFKNPHQPGAVRAAPGGAGCSPTVPP